MVVRREVFFEPGTARITWTPKDPALRRSTDSNPHAVLPDRREQRKASTNTYRPVATPFQMYEKLAQTFQQCFGLV
jgi:hypothetical protein